MENNLLFTSLNNVEPYRTQAIALLSCLKINNPGQLIQVNCYNFDGDFYKQYNENAIIVNRVIPSRLDIREYLTCTRAALTVENLDKYKRVAWIDTDVLIRGDISEFWSLIQKNKILITWRPHMRRRYRVAAGFYGVTNSPIIKKMFEAYKRVLVMGYKTWGNGQYNLYKCINKFRIPIIPIPTYLHDLNWDLNSKVWHVRHGFFNDPIWVAEYHKYIRLAYGKPAHYCV